jgi:hypothetical protein
MADAGSRRDDAKVLERALRPFQEFVALLVLRYSSATFFLNDVGVPAKFTITE